LTLAAFVVALVALALALPAAAAAAEFTLEVESAGSGEGTVGCVVNAGPLEECEAEYEEGTEVMLLAEPEEGSEFTGFSAGTGSASACSASPCTFTIEADSSVTATFDLEEFELTVETEGSGEGLVECQVEGGSYEACPESETYAYGTEVILFAEPEEGSEFVEWGGDCTGVEAECALTIEEPLGVSATFEPEPPFALTIETSGTGSGEVECEVEGGEAEECEAEYEEGTEVALVPLEDPGSEFTGWSGDCTGSGACELTMDEDKEVTATFDEEEVPTPEFDLTIVKAGTGSGTVTCDGGACASTYEEGTEVSLVPIEDPGSEFVKWSGDCTGTGACELTMDEDKEVTATFDEEEPAPEEFSLTVTKAGTGSGTVACDGGACAPEYPEGTEVTLSATAASGSTFSGWSGAGCSGTGTCELTIEEDTTVTVTFTADPAPPPPTCATDPSLCPPPPPPAEGKAKAAASAKFKSGKAELKLSCTGGPCKGTLKLTAKVKQGGKAKNLLIGKASFSIPEGATKTLKVKLSGPARTELGKGRTLKAKTSGTGVTASTVKVKPAKKAS
jgi:hypothetical protein